MGILIDLCLRPRPLIIRRRFASDVRRDSCGILANFALDWVDIAEKRVDFRDCLGVKLVINSEVYALGGA